MVWCVYNILSINVNFVWNHTKIEDTIHNNLDCVRTYVYVNTYYTYVLVAEMKYYLFLRGTMAVINAA
jgi:hypothetical protein